MRWIRGTGIETDGRRPTSPTVSAGANPCLHFRNSSSFPAGAISCRFGLVEKGVTFHPHGERSAAGGQSVLPYDSCRLAVSPSCRLTVFPSSRLRATLSLPHPPTG